LFKDRPAVTKTSSNVGKQPSGGQMEQDGENEGGGGGD